MGKESKTFESLHHVGDELRLFADRGLMDIISDHVCQDCSGQDCNDGCYGMVVIDHIEEHIGQAMIAYGEQLVKNWSKI